MTCKKESVMAKENFTCLLITIPESKHDDFVRAMKSPLVDVEQYPNFKFLFTEYIDQDTVDRVRKMLGESSVRNVERPGKLQQSLVL